MTTAPRTRRDFPSADEGHEAYGLGQKAALDGLGRHVCPWDIASPDFRTSCLAASWRRGFTNGLQTRLLRHYGDAPTA